VRFLHVALFGTQRSASQIRNFTFADLGSELTIALRQEAVQDGDPVMGFFDSITVTTEESRGSLLGDVNLDGEVNGLDVDPFVDVLLTGPYPPEADMNEDQVVNGLDVDPFVVAVVGGVQQIPEPSTFLLALCSLAVVGGWRMWAAITKRQRSAILPAIRQPLVQHIEAIFSSWAKTANSVFPCSLRNPPVKSQLVTG
jgi:hypothetical protein